MKFKLRDKKILLLEGSKANNWQLTEKYSNRVVALNPATQKLLESIGAWGHIERARYGSVKKMQVGLIYIQIYSCDVHNNLFLFTSKLNII